jgi:F-type H+-transporting ATPase subunit delta
MNIIPAVVTTAVELANEEKDLFKRSLEKYSEKKVRISFSVNPDLIGGFLVQLKDKMLDASVKQQLNLLRKRLAKADQALVN